MKRATMVREHIANATDAELGERLRALVEQGYDRFEVTDKPVWMKRDHFLPVGEVEERDTVFGKTREEWKASPEDWQRMLDGE